MRLRLCAFALLLGAVLAVPARATEAYMANFESSYPDALNSRIDTCSLCHTIVPNRNLYGAAFKTANHNFTAIQNADSDGDGFTNLAEITALTFPGIPSDKPAPATGSLTVTLVPPGAVTAGAQWRVGPSGPYQNSGATVAGLALGTVSIQFKALTGWLTPASQSANILAGQTSTAAGAYIPSLVTVPNVVGQTQSMATNAITAAGLTVGTITQAFSPTVSSGQVISQTPAAGASTAGGSAVLLTVSKGPQPVTVPNVVGQTQAEAATAITAAGLVVGAVTQRHDAAVPDGMVISQTPVAGAQASPGSAVGLLMSLGPGPVTVPDVTGQAQAAAATAIANAGLTLGTILQEYSATVPVGRVSSQTPSANASVDAGSAVTLVLSQGPQPVPVPDVAGLTQDAAAAAIAAAGLAVGQVNEAPNDTVPAGSVISQTPVAGTLAAPSSLVNLTVSSGPESAGCACLNSQKGAFSTENGMKLLGDLFLVGLSLVTLQTMARKK